VLILKYAAIGTTHTLGMNAKAPGIGTNLQQSHVQHAMAGAEAARISKSAAWPSQLQAVSHSLATQHRGHQCGPDAQPSIGLFALGTSLTSTLFQNASARCGERLDSIVAAQHALRLPLLSIGKIDEERRHQHETKTVTSSVVAILI
jgi:hypothetical protein